MGKTNGTPKIASDKKGLLARIGRRVKLIYLKILGIDDPPERIARGAAIGVAMGVLPTFGLGTLFALAFAFVFRANKAASVLGSFIMNPVTTPFFWTASLVTGSLLTGNDYSAIYAKMKENGLLTGAGEASVVFIAGNLGISIASN